MDLILSSNLSSFRSVIRKLMTLIFQLKLGIFWEKRLDLLITFLILYVYNQWFAINKTLSSGDWPYLFVENIKEFSFLPTSGFLWIAPYYQVTAKILVEHVGLNWYFAEKVLWFWPFMISSFSSSFYFSKIFFPNSKLTIFIPFIFMINTYTLMLVGGGQMGVGLAYSLAPLVLASFVRLIDSFYLQTQNIKYANKHFQFSVLAGLILSIQMMFDPRITYITFIAIFLYLFLTFIQNTSKKNFLKKSFFLIIPVLISLALNSFWIVPLLKYGFSSNYEGYSSLLGFQFLSFADFSHSFSLLHPNWPENIFGKIYFMKPEFILLPILAYSSLFFLKSKVKSQKSKLQFKTQNLKINSTIKQDSNITTILFFALLGLLGAFLAKGSNPPFGQINEFLFQYFPGMNMFRDATKFYLLTVLSYSVLVPYAIIAIYDRLRFSTEFSIKSKIFNFQNLFLIAAFLYLIFLIRPALMGELGGTFKPREVPHEYIQLKNFIYNQPQFFRTLWVPSRQRFGFYSVNHPAIEAFDFFNTNSIDKMIQEFKKNDVQTKLQKASIKYIIIPYDSEKEIFLKDRQYNQEEHIFLLEKVRSLNWFKEIFSFKEIAVFELSP